MHRLLAVCAALMGLLTTGLAAFDLQFVSKFNTLLPIDTALTKIIPNGSGGFYAAGTSGGDVLLCEFDAVGTLIRSTRWDSPQVLTDTPVRIDRSSDTGVVTVTVNSRGPSQSRMHLVQYSPTFAVNWFKELLVFSSDAVILTATCRDGVSAVALLTGPGLQIKVIRADGTDGPQRTLPGIFPSDIEPSNTSSNRGFVISGRRNNQPFVTRFTIANNASLYETEGTGEVGASNLVRQVVIDSTGTVFGIGVKLDGGLAKLAYYRVSPTGTMTVGLDQATRNPSTIAFGGGNLCRGVVFNGGTREIVEFDRDTLTTGLVYEGLTARTFAAVENANVLFASDTVGGTVALDTVTGSTLDTFAALGLGDMTALNPDLAAGVGQDGSGGALVATMNGSAVAASSLVLSGAANRTLVDSDIAADGSVATLSSLVRFGREEATTTLHRPDGTLAFARAFAFGNAAIEPRLVKVMSNGTVVAVGRATIAGVSTVVITRYAANGATSFSQSYALPSGLKNVGSLGEVGNDLLLHGAVNDTREGFARVAANGILVFDRSIPSSKLITFSPMASVNGGDRVGIVVVRSNNNMDVNLISTVNGNVLASTTFATPGSWFQAFAKTTSTGDLFVCAAQDGDARLGILSKTNLATIQSSTIPEFISAADAGSGNRFVVVGEVPGTRKIRMLGSNLAQLSETTLDATITRVADVSLDGSNLAYLLAEETPQIDVTSVYSAKYLANGARSAVRRLSGEAHKIRALTPTGVWLTGRTQERTRGRGPFVARFSP